MKCDLVRGRSRRRSKIGASMSDSERVLLYFYRQCLLKGWLVAFVSRTTQKLLIWRIVLWHRDVLRLIELPRGLTIIKCLVSVFGTGLYIIHGSSLP